MKKIKFSYIKQLALVMLFVSCMFCKEEIYSQGPNAPEAASFEPVDATDMVNLVTGDLSYVLPLLNVPSPEGGYPIALSYHAGIAMDQQASWTGLGWNLNVGAINRSTNGYPDDYNNALLTEYFYDEGGKESIYTISLGYSNGVSVGVNMSWGSNKSLGGSIGIGVGMEGFGAGISIGEGGVGLNASVNFAENLSLGINASSNSGIGGSIGFNSNGFEGGIGISSSGIVTSSVDAGPLGFSLSSSNGGGSASFSVAGIGLSTSFNNSIKMGDYSVKSSSWSIPLYVPTPIGAFSLSFGKQEFRYYLGQKEEDFVCGPLFFQNAGNGGNWICRFKVGSRIVGQGYRIDIYSSHIVTSSSHEHSTDYNIEWEEGESFMDIYEFSINDLQIENETNLKINNAVFPSYDSYNVQAQGLSGNISTRLYENGNLYGLSKRENSAGYEVNYSFDYGLTQEHLVFNDKPYFQFENEISTYLGVAPALFDISNNSNSPIDFYESGVNPNSLERSKSSNYIECYSNDEIINNYNNLKLQGFLDSNSSGFERATKPLNGIGAFKITAIDGKTYHYSLPVYNHEIITRTFGIVDNGDGSNYEVATFKKEEESYFEKRQLEPYATHWLLTAITGPDFIDDGNGIVGEGDIGYWVSFDYGKWSDANVWKNPYGKDYLEDPENPNIKTFVKGRKQIYYLDKVKTRTHTALFVKKEREDFKSEEWKYRSVNHFSGGSDENDKTLFNSNEGLRFTLPEQNLLRLEKIIILKNDDDVVLKNYGADNSNFETIYFNDSSKPGEDAYYNLTSNVIDISDNIENVISKALRVINFGYDYSLVEGDNRLTLNEVSFGGKGGMQLIPPYKFKYNNSSENYNIENSDQWGYYKFDNSLWSLNEVVTPQGGSINISYKPHQSYSVVDHIFKFSNYSKGAYTCTYPIYNSITDVSNKKIELQSDAALWLDIGTKVKIKYESIYPPINGNAVKGSYDDYGTITADLGGNKYEVTFDEDIHLEYGGTATNVSVIEGLLGGNKWDVYEKFYRSTEVELNSEGKIIQGGGIRVSKIEVTDGSNKFSTNYSYGENGDGVGYVSYLPYATNLQKEVPYSSELPFPRVLYEFVSVDSKGSNNDLNSRTDYVFKVLKSKEPNKIKFGDLYEIDVTSETNSVGDKEVNISNYIIKDNLATLGSLLEVSSYNEYDHLFSKIRNEYFLPEETPNNIGKTMESYQSYKSVDYEVNTASLKDKWLINSSTRIKYPSLLKSSAELNKGVKYSTNYQNFDPITGIARDIDYESSNGEKYRMTSVPAYEKYSKMGSKVDDITNKNMLSQEAANYTYLLDGNDNVDKVITASIVTWNNDWQYRDVTGYEWSPTNDEEKIWRKHKTYVWDGSIDLDGAYSGFDEANDDDFNWGLEALQTNANWQEVSEVTRYDNYSAPQETEDINGNLAAVKMCDAQSKVLAVSNAAYTELYYSGAEYVTSNSNYFDGEVKSFGKTSAKAHTGFNSIIIGSGQKGFEVNMASGEHRSGQYKISVWVNYQAAAYARIYINGSKKPFNGESNLRAGDWVLLNHYESLDAGAEQIYVTASSGYVYFDDFRLYPVSSTLTGYVYNEWDELWYIIGDNGLSTKYEYDEAGRLKQTSVEVLDYENPGSGGFKPVNQNEYHYKQELNVVPEIPTGLLFDSATETSLSFSWDEVTDATGYKVYKDGVFESVVSTNSAMISGLAHSTTYEIQVLAYNDVGDGELCSSLSMTTESPVTYTNKGTIYNYSNSTISASTVVITVNNSTTASFNLPAMAPGEHFDFSSGYSQPIYSNGTFKVSMYNTTSGISSSNYFNMTSGSSSTDGNFSYQGWGYGATVYSSGPQYSLVIRIY